jgi:AAA-like domain/TIR domain
LYNQALQEFEMTPQITSGTDDVPRFFISYKRDHSPDEALADELFRQLNIRFVDNIFLDRQSLKLGDDWRAVIGPRIRNADYFIILLSPSVFQNPDNIRDEYDIAVEQFERTKLQPRIVPVVLSSGLTIPDPFVRTKRYHRFDWRDSNDTNLLIEKISELTKDHLLRQKAAKLNSTPVEPSEDFYVIRKSDERMMRAIARRGVTISLIGPMQTGKTLLLQRAMERASSDGKTVAYVNMATLAEEAGQGPNQFTRAFLLTIRESLNKVPDSGLQVPVPQYSLDELTPAGACTRFLEYNVLRPIQRAGGHLVLALDDLDAVLRTPSSATLIPMLRSWHGQRSYPNSVWKRLDLILVAYNHLFSYTRINPPFNVGEDVVLEDFAPDEISELNLAYQLPADVSQVDRLHKLIGGHPYLTQIALKHLNDRTVQGGLSEVLDLESVDLGPFGDHLSLLRKNVADAGLERPFQDVLLTHRCSNEDVFQQLLREGLIRRERSLVQSRCRLYEQYFTSVLGERS